LSAALDTLELTRHGLLDSLGEGSGVGDWAEVVAAYARDVAVTAPAELLPELAADLELLQATTAATPQTASALTGSTAELAGLMALTLTGLGRSRAAMRWWRTARAMADRSDDARVRSSVRSWEVVSGITERRPLPELLDLAGEAQAIADRPSCSAQALSGRAQVLALLGNPEAARQAVDDLAAVVADLPADLLSESSLLGWPSYRLPCVESYVYTALGDTMLGYLAQEQALSLCPAEHRRERAEVELHLAWCLVQDREVAAGLATAMRVLVELPDQWHTEFLYDAAGRVLSAVPAADLGRPAIRDYRELLVRRPYQRR
jgi:hypothetical protein